MLTLRKKPLVPTISQFLNDDWANLFDWSGHDLMHSSTLPAVNVKETDESYLVEMAAPGMSREDFNVELNNGVLTIESTRTDESETTDDNNDYHRKEFTYSSFKRTFNLSEDLVDEEGINAKYKDGILSVFLPKKEEVKQKKVKRIEIS